MQNLLFCRLFVFLFIPFLGISQNCPETTAEINLEVNNVRAGLRNGGDLWWKVGDLDMELCPDITAFIQDADSVDLVYEQQEDLLLHQEFISYGAEPDKVKIFPNPTKEGIWVEVEDHFTEVLQMEMYDLFGKQYLHLENIHQNQYYLDLSAFPPGNYLLKSHCSDGETYVEKVIVLE